MKIMGVVISGTKEGAYFMSQEVYKSQFKNKVGFEPFLGTLNVQLDEDEVSKISGIPDEYFGIIKGSGNFGDVKYIKTSLNDGIDGALIFPVKTHHPKNTIEFIAPLNLRKTLNLKDGDVISLKVKD
ncbi:MAG: CTP-dependent riboflavin kinase [Euryarchaeota archaeon]|nr:CTP-dependent riboflavin kinase [Euryarchaeota archaeon]